MRNLWPVVNSVVGAAVLFCCVGCSPERKVEGQVFVVMQSRDNVKMGLVGIHVATAEQLRAVVTEAGAVYLHSDQEWRARIAQSKANVDEAVKFRDTLFSAKPEGLADETRIRLQDAVVFKVRELEAAVSSNYSNVPSSLSDFETSIFSKLLQPVTKTDADGRFSLTAKPGDWLLAHSERKILGNEETYFWAVQVPQEKKPLLISNDTLVQGELGFHKLYSSVCGSRLEPLAMGEAKADEQTTKWVELAQAALNKVIEVEHATKERLEAEAKAVEEKAAADRKAHEAWLAEIKAIEDKRAADEARYAAERAVEQEKNRAEKERIRIENSMPRAGKKWLVPGLNLEILPVSRGKFVMGSEEGGMGSSNEKPLTEVTLTKPFWLGKTAVTQAQYELIMGKNPSNFKGADLPVEQVSWNDAVEFCRRLNEKEKSAGRIPDGYAYALPTEVQRDYACRAGVTAQGKGDLDEIAWYGKLLGSTHPVAQKKPNAWGFYDMQGNVYEWCSDWFGSYPGGSVIDPKGPASGSTHVVRGGAWNVPGTFCRISFRYDYKPTKTQLNVGFRLALVPNP